MKRRYPRVRNLANLRKAALRIGSDLHIGEPQREDAERFQPPVAEVVVGKIVLCAVRLDGKSRRVAVEVEEEAAHRMLPPPAMLAAA